LDVLCVNLVVGGLHFWLIMVVVMAVVVVIMSVLGFDSEFGVGCVDDPVEGVGGIFSSGLTVEERHGAGGFAVSEAADCNGVVVVLNECETLNVRAVAWEVIRDVRTVVIEIIFIWK